MSEADNIIKAPPVIGTPENDADFFPGQQERQDSCAIRCQEMILKEFGLFGETETSLVQQASEEGWYAPGEGTRLDNVGNLLETHGLEVNRYEQATSHHLAAELAQGHKVIIGVDSYQLWGETESPLHAVLSELGFTAADHAVIVTGIDTSVPGETRIVISDPGTGEAAASYPIDEFMQAWSGSNFYMVATVDAVPKDNPAMVNFDYEHGYMEQFGLTANNGDVFLSEPKEKDALIGLLDFDEAATLNREFASYDQFSELRLDVDDALNAQSVYEEDFAKIDTGLDFMDTANDNVSSDPDSFFDEDITEE